MEHKQIKMVVVDMDGTFLNDDKKIHPDSFRVINKLNEKDIKFVIASGRHYFSLYDKMNKNNDILYITENGGQIINGTKEIFYDAIDKNFLLETITKANNITGTFLILSGRKGSYTSRIPEDVYQGCKEYYKILHKVDNLQLIQDDIFMITIFNYSNETVDLTQVFQKFANNFGFSHSGDSKTHKGSDWVKIFNKNVNKGVALNHILQKYNINDNEVMIFGDNMNDYEMFELNQQTYAMKNSHDNLKKIAKNIIGNNNDFAVIEVLKDKFNI